MNCPKDLSDLSSLTSALENRVSDTENKLSKIESKHFYSEE